MNRWFNFHRDLGLQLLALYLLLIIPFLVALLVFDGLIGHRIREDVQASDLSLARAIAQEADLSIGSALEVVKGLSGYPSVIAADPVGIATDHQIILRRGSGVLRHPIAAERRHDSGDRRHTTGATRNTARPAIASQLQRSLGNHKALAGGTW